MAFGLEGFLTTVASTAISSLLGGDDPPAAAAATATPAAGPAVVAGIPNAQMAMAPVSQTTLTGLKPGAIQVLRMIGEGSSDSMVRTAARELRVGKKDLFQALIAINFLGRGALTRSDRMFISNEIEKIFRRRRTPVISRSVKRDVKRMEFWMKTVRKFAGSRGHAHFTTTTRGHK